VGEQGTEDGKDKVQGTDRLQLIDSHSQANENANRREKQEVGPGFKEPELETAWLNRFHINYLPNEQEPDRLL